jgi:hypothetical protein
MPKPVSPPSGKTASHACDWRMRICCGKIGLELNPDDSENPYTKFLSDFSEQVFQGVKIARDENVHHLFANNAHG